MCVINPKLKTIALVFFAGFLVFTIKAQQTRAVGDFNGIKAGDSFTITISQSDVNTVKVDADEKIQAQIKTEVKEGILIIGTEGIFKTDKPVVIAIGVKALNSLTITGATDVKTENQLICDKLSVESSGTWDIRLDIKASDLKMQMNGSGDVTLNGTTQNLDATVSGVGDLKAGKLEADKAIVKVSGLGSAKINVKQKLNATVSGSGDIIYKGNPAERTVEINGTGSVRESKTGTGEETESNVEKLIFKKKRHGIVNDDDDSEESDRKNFLKKYSYGFKHWAGLELGVNGLLDFNNSLNAPEGAGFLELNYARSFQFGINLLEKDFHIYKNYVNIVTGLGFDFNHYALKNDVSLNSKTEYLSASNDSSIRYKKNTLNVSYVKVPLMLEFNTNKNASNNLHFAIGGEFEYRIHSVTKQKYEVDDKIHKIKNRDDFNLAPFLYNAVVRVGYNNITLFAHYGLNRLFLRDKGPQVYPFTLGITLSL